MKVLVTGATGYIGGRLLNRLLKEGYSVNAITRNAQAPDLIIHPALNWFEGDLTNREAVKNAMQGCEVVFNLAALARVWTRSESDYFQNNTDGAVNIFDCASELGIRRVVHISTAGIYPESKPFIKDRIAAGIDHESDSYILSKLVAEHAALRYAIRGLDIVILCPSRVYGPGKQTASNPFARIFLWLSKINLLFVPGNGNAIGSYCYVDDIIEVMLNAVNSGTRGEVYLLGGENISFNEVADVLRSASGTSPRIIRVPVFILKFLGTMEVFLGKISNHKPVVSPAWIRRMIHNYFIDSTRAMRDLNYKITPFQKGIEYAFEEYNRDAIRSSPKKLVI